MSILRLIYPSILRTQVVKPAFRSINKRSFTSTIAAMAQTEWKLKDLSSLDLKNGQKQEAEVEGI